MAPRTKAKVQPEPAKPKAARPKAVSAAAKMPGKAAGRAKEAETANYLDGFEDDLFRQERIEVALLARKYRLKYRIGVRKPETEHD